MGNPLLAPALISAGGSLLGGLFGSKSAEKRQSESTKLTREQMAMQRQQFDAQMDESIQRRVKDAKAAGLHPLFALGASPGASPTATIGGQSDSGNLLGEGIGRAARHVAQAFDPATRAQIANLESSTEANFAQAQLYRSQAKRAEVEANSSAVRTFAATEPAVFGGVPIAKRDAFKTPIGVARPGKYAPVEELEKWYGDIASVMGALVAGEEMYRRSPSVRFAHPMRAINRLMYRGLKSMRRGE